MNERQLTKVNIFTHRCYLKSCFFLPCADMQVLNLRSSKDPPVIKNLKVAPSRSCGVIAERMTVSFLSQDMFLYSCAKSFSSLRKYLVIPLLN